MPIEWVGESLPTTYKPEETRPVTPSDRGKSDREQNAAWTNRRGARGANPYNQALTRQNQRLEQAVFAKEVMQTRMQTVEPEQPLHVAVKLFADHHIDHLPVKNRSGKLVGILSQHDVMRTLAGGRRPEDVLIAEVMTGHVLTATGNTTLREISRVMVMEDIHCIPIVDSGQKMIGLLTAADMLQCMVNHHKLNVWI
ncbi:MAG: CBS domain-containing protein [Rhodothermales bacterium]